MKTPESMNQRRCGKMIDLFMWWMTERHDIYLRRQNGQPWPWTEDEVLRTYKFTNVYRELDRVTIELSRRMRVVAKKSLHDRLFHVILFRAFNWPATYDKIVNERGDAMSFARMRVTLKAAAKTEKIFTGAYIITNAGSKRSKVELMVDAMETIWHARHEIWRAIELDGTMQGATKILTAYPSFGNFTAYEVVCDLRHQKGMLDKAPDVMTWANLGPGAKRGIQRIHGGGKRVKFNASSEFFVGEMQYLLQTANEELPSRMPRLEMREIEHSLCEFDKYLRVKRGEGRPRSKYVHAD